MTRGRCPSDRVLAEFVVGLADLETTDRLSDHVGVCVRCAERLAREAAFEVELSAAFAPKPAPAAKARRPRSAFGLQVAAALTMLLLLATRGEPPHPANVGTDAGGWAPHPRPLCLAMSRLGDRTWSESENHDWCAAPAGIACVDPHRGG